MPKAIVTLAVGDYYRDRWEQYIRENWEHYANRHNYDIICVTKAIDSSLIGMSRSPAWQKCLILGHKSVERYDQVVWLDSDVIINPHAPCIAKLVPVERIGAVDALEQFSNDDGVIKEHIVGYMRWRFHSAREYYHAAGMPCHFTNVVQTGVMVLSPLHHRQLLESVYHHGLETPIGDFEMEHLSYGIISSGTWHRLDARFNRLWMAGMLKHYPFLLPPLHLSSKPVRVFRRIIRGHYTLPARKFGQPCLNAAFINSHFLHFAGAGQYIPWIANSIRPWNALLR